MLSRLVIAAIVLASAPAAAQRVVAIAPLSSLGEEDTTASTKKTVAQLEAAVAALPNTRVVKAADVVQAINKAKKPQLKICEAQPDCLAELGRLVGAQVVIAGEVVGLGNAKVIYLGATDVTSARELRSTTLTLGADAGDDPNGAVIRLLEPERYRGTLQFAIDVQGANVFVNGSKIKLSPKGEVALPVGRHAVRVTHPEYRDFVRFIDVQFGRTTDVAVGMQQYPIVQRDLQGKPINRDTVVYVDPPMWRRWYVVAPAATGLAILAGIIAGSLARDLPDAPCRKVGGEPC